MDIELDEMNFNNLDYGALGRIRIGSMALSTLISAVLTFITCFIVMQIILKTLERILGRANKIDGTLKGFIHSAVKIVLWILTGIIYFSGCADQHCRTCPFPFCSEHSF